MSINYVLESELATDMKKWEIYFTQKIKLNGVEEAHFKGETRNYEHPLCRLSKISRTAETNKFWEPLSEHEEADIHIKGVLTKDPM